MLSPEEAEKQGFMLGVMFCSSLALIAFLIYVLLS